MYYQKKKISIIEVAYHFLTVLFALAIVSFGLSEFCLARLLVFQRLRILQKVVFDTIGMCDGTKEIK